MKSCSTFSLDRSSAHVRNNADWLTVATAAKLDAVLAQVNQDQKDLKGAIAANIVSPEGAAGLKAANGMYCSTFSMAKANKEQLNSRLSARRHQSRLLIGRT